MARSESSSLDEEIFEFESSGGFIHYITIVMGGGGLVVMYDPHDN